MIAVLAYLPAMSIPTNIFLVGPMGAGKSTIGRHLAELLGKSFYDADEEIEKRTGASITWIFDIEGEPGFRKRESAVLEELTQHENVVVATGGGAILEEGNRALLKARGTVVYLAADIDTLAQRTRRDRARPLLQTADRRQRIDDLMKEREPLYRATADVTVAKPVDARRCRSRARYWQRCNRCRPMKTLELELGERSYPIHIGAGLLTRAELIVPHLIGERFAIISNETVAPLYLQVCETTLAEYQPVVIVLPDGEQYKTLDVLDKVFTTLLTERCDRRTTLLALGGGVIGDMTGFAAACYLRGVPFIQLPTTLLAQVDSSVGGKTGVNHRLGKNMIGAFYQPRCVVIDTDTLDTLPDRELSAGLAEVIKYGLLHDASFFEWLESNVDKLLERDKEALSSAILRSCEIKAAIVAADEREAGIRALLNLGHTFGHAIEAAMGYGTWLHGEAVAAGIMIAADLSHRFGWLQAEELARIETVLARAGLPVRAPAAMTPERFMAFMSLDKKVQSGRLRLVLLERIGAAVVSDDIDQTPLTETLEQCRSQQ